MPCYIVACCSIQCDNMLFRIICDSIKLYVQRHARYITLYCTPLHRIGFCYMVYYASRPLCGSESGVCVYFVYVCIVFWFVGSPWVSLRAPKGLPLASLWLPFGSLGTPWGHMGRLGLPRGAWDDLWVQNGTQFQANGSQVARLRTKKDPAEFSAFSEQWAQSGAGAAAPNPTLLAPGARMTVFKHTPSNHFISCHVILQHRTSYQMVWCYVVSRCAILYHTVLHCMML